MEILSHLLNFALPLFALVALAIVGVLVWAFMPDAPVPPPPGHQKFDRHGKPL